MGHHHSRDEFDRFVATSADELLRTAYLVVWDVPAAEDLVQECLFVVARRWPRVRTMDHPSAYARRVVVNLALRRAKRHSRDRSELHWPPADAPDAAAAGGFARVDAGSQLVEALGELTERQRAVLVLRYFLDLPEVDVAEAMGCSVGTVKSTASRALARVRELDRKEYLDEPATRI
jgi:RNA polymerase sigma-70 factor (sigma-E family)